MNIYLVTNIAPRVRPTSVEGAVEDVLTKGQPFLRATVVAENAFAALGVKDANGVSAFPDLEVHVDKIGVVWGSHYDNAQPQVITMEMGWAK